MWLDAAVNITISSGVSRWGDKTNNQIHFWQNGASNQPGYTASNASFNNLPTVDMGFRGNLAGSSTFGLGATTLAVVVRMAGVGSSYNNILGNGGATGLLGGGTNGNITGFGFYSNSGSPWVRTNVEDTSMHILVCNRSAFVVDGVNILQTAWGLSNGVSGNFNDSFSQIGNPNGSGTTPSSAQIAEILLYDGILSSERCIELCNRLNEKYNKY